MQTSNGKDILVGQWFNESNSRVGYHITEKRTPEMQTLCGWQEMESFCSISPDDETGGWAADINSCQEFYKPTGGIPVGNRGKSE